MVFKVGDMKYIHRYQILKWKFNKPYDVYNFPDLLLNPEVVINNKYFACLNEDKELVGYYCINEEARVVTNESRSFYTDDFIDMGLSLRPDLTGKGLGLSFVQYGIDFLKNKFNTNKIRLTVATFNERATKVYEKAGFIEGERFIRECDDGDYEFMIMYLKD